MKRLLCSLCVLLFITSAALAETIDVTKSGVNPATPDVTVALETLINSQPDGTAFYFPQILAMEQGGKGPPQLRQQHYRTSRPIVINRELCTLKGDGSAIGSATGTIFVGNHAGPIFQFSDKGTYNVSGFGFINRHVAGIGLDFQGTNQGSGVERCTFHTGSAGTIVRNAKQFRYVGNYHRNCGLAASLHGHTRIENFQAIACKEGLWVSHYGVTGDQLRFEVNGTALRIGHDWNDTPTGKKDPCSGLSLSTLTFEANDTAIIYGGGGNNTISNASIYGTTNAPSGKSQIGIDITDGARGISWNQISVHGSYTVGGLIARTEKRADPLLGQHKFDMVNVTNQQRGTDNPDMGWIVEFFSDPRTKALRRLQVADMPNSAWEMSNQ